MLSRIPGFLLVLPGFQLRNVWNIHHFLLKTVIMSDINVLKPTVNQEVASFPHVSVRISPLCLY